ncbi:glycoside hydrolase family 47 protein [Lentinula aciculospora]|uniref:alpha-1,2-Mannosidase n=1 Tax=Lentinula aciculospora TaxID=153920 RepID=A0A9W8ZYQ3_9AGAR|nr:glycoside hydrolase family 47 protein [Lentinula aciculospora]
MGLCYPFTWSLLLWPRPAPLHDQKENVQPPVFNPDAADVDKREAIVSAFKHAWAAYERDAMGSDEYHPISKKGENLAHSGGIGYTVVDALDTMYLLGLQPEYQRARTWIDKKLNFNQPGEFSTFETSIRVLGGFLSTYYLTSDRLLLARAVDLADRLIMSFDTESGLPLPEVDLKNRKGVADKYSADRISTAEAATLQLEFRYLADLTKNDTYWYKAEHVMSVIEKAKLPHNLVPIYISASQGTFTDSEIRLGSRRDSCYEYLLKQYLQTARTESVYRKMYMDSMQGVHDELVQTTPIKNMTYIAELIPKNYFSGNHEYTLQHKQDHLVRFLAGSLMLGATTIGAVRKSVSVPPQPHELSAEGMRDWQTGVNLLETCMYTHETATGLAPEIAMFRTNKETEETRDWYIKNSRPETVESLFIAWRLSGIVRYRDYAWGIFTSIEKYAKLPGGGYATVLDVDTVPVSLDDKQETFFLVGSAPFILLIISSSETLKYLYLIFCDSFVLPLQDIVFNTEAHPLPVFAPTIKPRFSSGTHNH